MTISSSLGMANVEGRGVEMGVECWLQSRVGGGGVGCRGKLDLECWLVVID